MFKRFNFKTLSILFLVLLAIVVIIRVVHHSKGDRNFKASFFELDTAKVSSITILPHPLHEQVSLTKKGKTWILTKKNKQYAAEESAIRSILSELQNMKPEFLAATEKSDWPTYQLTDTGSTRVKVEQDGKLVADFLLGKVSFKQYEQTTFIRNSNETSIYAVNGLLGLVFNREADDFRNKTMVTINNTRDIRKVDFNYPDSSFTLLKDKDGWKINETLVDSIKVANYLSSMNSLVATDFVDDSVISGNQVFSVQITGDNFNPIVLKAFRVNTLDNFIVTSSMNAEGRFSGAHGDLAKRLFVGAGSFKKNKNSKM